MPKRFISKYLPHASTVTKHRSISWLGNILHDSNLWHLNRRSVASAMFAGVFACFIPLPGQMLIAASLAIFLHCNLPLSLALTWISNPLTYAPIYYLCYRLGLIILGQDHPSELQWSMDELADNVSLVMKPLLIGCVISGLAFGAFGYLVVRLLWRLHIQRAWIKRKALRAKNRIGNAIKQVSKTGINPECARAAKENSTSAEELDSKHTPT